ncbi:hypothetical protein [Actinophytocola sp.]|uniref:hypothetical protein n=1 Tax=Actinophytocola sp. TaxID=1872138 RepID=UPI003D6A816C
MFTLADPGSWHAPDRTTHTDATHTDATHTDATHTDATRYGHAQARAWDRCTHA